MSIFIPPDLKSRSMSFLLELNQDIHPLQLWYKHGKVHLISIGQWGVIGQTEGKPLHRLGCGGQLINWHNSPDQYKNIWGKYNNIINLSKCVVTKIKQRGGSDNPASTISTISNFFMLQITGYTLLSWTKRFWKFFFRNSLYALQQDIVTWETVAMYFLSAVEWILSGFSIPSTW